MKGIQSVCRPEKTKSCYKVSLLDFAPFLKLFKTFRSVSVTVTKLENIPVLKFIYLLVPSLNYIYPLIGLIAQIYKLIKT